jgi:hypothetical protein
MHLPEPERFEVIPLTDGDFRIVSPVRCADGRRVAFYLDGAGGREGLLTDRGETWQGLRVSAADKKRINRLIAPAAIGPTGVIRLRLPWERIQAPILFPFARSLATLAILAAARRAPSATGSAPTRAAEKARTPTDDHLNAEPKRAGSAPVHQARSHS